jgi:hypothetical protein
MVLEIEAARPGAEALAKLGRFLLELVDLRMLLGRSKMGPKELPPPSRPWKAVPKGPDFIVKEYLGITGNPPFARIGTMGADDCLISYVQVSGKEVVYHVDAIAAAGADAAKVKAAHRAMVLAAAKEARARGQQQFTLYGSQVNPNGRAHLDRLAKAVGVPGSGRNAGGPPPFGNYAVTLDANKVLASNLDL